MIELLRSPYNALRTLTFKGWSGSNPGADIDGFSDCIDEAETAKMALKEAEKELKNEDWSCDLLNFTMIVNNDWDSKMFSTEVGLAAA